MSDIFISYKREEQAEARKLADALENGGWSVWWDPKLRAGDRFDDIIQQTLNDARCVIVMWSERSVQSRYVRDEATYALDNDKLVPVAIDHVNLPFRFRGVQTRRLVDWDGSEDFSEFRRLVEDIATILGPSANRAVPSEDQQQDVQPPDENIKEKGDNGGRKRVRQKYAWRVSGFAATAVVAILAICAFWPKGAAENIIVLVADFDGPDTKTYGVTEMVIRQLRQATERYTDVEIHGLKKTITEQDGSKVAQAEGKKRKATMVLWGWYRIPGEVVPLSVQFEILRPIKDFLSDGQTTRSDIQQASIADLKSFTLQTRLSKEMTTLSLIVLALARRAAGDAEGAISRFNDALHQTTEAPSNLNRSFVYFHRGITYLIKGDSDRSLADLTQAIKFNPTFSEAYVNRALIYVVKGDYNHALTDVNRAVQLKPDSRLAYNNRGLIYLQTEQYELAIADFSHVLKLLPKPSDSFKTIRPDSSEVGYSRPTDRGVLSFNFVFTELSPSVVISNRGAAYLGKSDHNRALADFNEAIRLQPRNIFGYFNRAAFYFKTQEYGRALADLNQIIKLQPDFAPVYLKRGVINLVQGNIDNSLADFNHTIKLRPDSGLSYMARGAVYAQGNDHDRALADFNEAIKLQPGVFIAYLQRGESYLEKGDHDRAFADFNYAIQLAPKSAEAYNSRGWAYAQKGNIDGALADINYALKLKPDEANFYDSRGFAYAGKGDYDRALADYNQALKLKPNADAYYHRGLVYRALGDHQKASSDFKRTLELTRKSKQREEAEKQLRDLGQYGSRMSRPGRVENRLSVS